MAQQPNRVSSSPVTSGSASTDPTCSGIALYNLLQSERHAQDSAGSNFPFDECDPRSGVPPPTQQQGDLLPASYSVPNAEPRLESSRNIVLINFNNSVHVYMNDVYVNSGEQIGRSAMQLAQAVALEQITKAANKSMTSSSQQNVSAASATSKAPRKRAAAKKRVSELKPEPSPDEETFTKPLRGSD